VKDGADVKIDPVINWLSTAYGASCDILIPVSFWNANEKQSNN
jgi:hypothetical protein